MSPDESSGGLAPLLRDAPPGPRSCQLAERLAELECPGVAHRRLSRAGANPRDVAPIVLASGRGAELTDVDGNRYVDLAAGFGAAILGHGHEAITHALSTQAAKLVQGLGDVYATETKIALLGELVRLHPGRAPQVLLGQSGSDAVTAALKTATLSTQRNSFVAFDGSYHGLGYGPLAACGFRASFRQPFEEQLSKQIRFAPYPGVRGASAEVSLSALRDLLRDQPTAAVLVEPIAGRGGCVVPPSGFLLELCWLAREHGALVIADEIWTGMGRCGAMLRSRQCNAPVDIVCLGKGLGGGLPISACIASADHMAGWAGGVEVVHTSTHVGAPLACSTALATLEALRTEGLVERSAALGQRFRDSLRQELAACEQVLEVRGAGLMIGIELDAASTAQSAIRQLLRRGYVVISGGIAGDTLTLTPPLSIEEDVLLGFGPCLREILQA